MGYVDEALENCTSRINNNNRARGKAFERRVSTLFNEYGFKTRRTPFSGASATYGKGDIEFLDNSPLFCECKNYKEDIFHFVQQAEMTRIMRKAAEQAGPERVAMVALRDTKGINIAVAQHYPEISCRVKSPCMRFAVDGNEWIVCLLEAYIEALADVYVKSNLLVGQGNIPDTQSPQG